jgi:hypothetical protein
MKDNQNAIEVDTYSEPASLTDGDSRASWSRYSAQYAWCRRDLERVQRENREGKPFGTLGRRAVKWRRKTASGTENFCEPCKLGQKPLDDEARELAARAAHVHRGRS